MGEPRASDLDKAAEEIHRRDHVLILRAAPPPVRVIPYDEVSRRLQARPKGDVHVK